MFNNEFILASAILEDQRENGELAPDKIMTLCNINNVSYEAVSAIIGDATNQENINNTAKFGLRFVAALSVAKSRDDDDDALKKATEAYLNYINQAQALLERYGDKADEMLIGFQEQINKLREM